MSSGLACVSQSELLSHQRGSWRPSEGGAYVLTCTLECLGLLAEVFFGEELIAFQQKTMIKHLEMTVCSQTEMLQ